MVATWNLRVQGGTEVRKQLVNNKGSQEQVKDRSARAECIDCHSELLCQ